MTIFSNLYNRLVRWRRPKPPPGMEERLSWLLQPYMHTVEDVLTWKNTTVSFIFFVFANIILWVLRTYNVRLFGIIGGSLLCAVILDALATALGERAGASTTMASSGAAARKGGRPALQLQEAKHRVEAAISCIGGQLATMRSNNHAQFCGVVCSSISVLWLVVWMGGGLFWHGLLSAALLYPLLPALETNVRHDSDNEVEGFLPELSPNELKELHEAGEHRPEPQEFSSLISDLSLPPDDVVLRKASGVTRATKESDLSFSDPESNSSLSDDEWMGNLAPGNASDSSDSNSKFLLHDNGKKTSQIVSSSPFTPTAPPQNELEDSDSDEFEIIDKGSL